MKSVQSSSNRWQIEEALFIQFVFPFFAVFFCVCLFLVVFFYHFTSALHMELFRCKLHEAPVAIIQFHLLVVVAVVIVVVPYLLSIHFLHSLISSAFGCLLMQWLRSTMFDVVWRLHLKTRDSYRTRSASVQVQQIFIAIKISTAFAFSSFLFVHFSFLLLFILLRFHSQQM